jgi:hypothetical protein
MASWTTDELAMMGDAEELGIAARRPDGTLRPYVTIWVVRVGDDLYVRAVNGRSNPWFRRAAAAGEGSIRAGGVEREVRFEEPGPAVADDITTAYHAKYDRYGPSVVGTVVSPEAVDATLRLVV